MLFRSQGLRLDYFLCNKAAELIKNCGADAFSSEVELDDAARYQLYQKTDLPHFENDSEVPLLVTRAELDTGRRTDGSGNVCKIKRSAAEETNQLFVENQKTPLEFKDF